MKKKRPDGVYRAHLRRGDLQVRNARSGLNLVQKTGYEVACTQAIRLRREKIRNRPVGVTWDWARPRQRQSRAPRFGPDFGRGISGESAW